MTGTVAALVVVFAAVALGVAAFALYVALSARSRALSAESRVARHQQEHRAGIEDEGLRRHRAGQPALTGQIPVVDDGPRPMPHPRPLPPPGQIGGRHS